MQTFFPTLRYYFLAILYDTALEFLAMSSIALNLAICPSLWLNEKRLSRAKQLFDKLFCLALV